MHKNDHHCEVVQPVCAGIHCAGGKDPHYPVCVPHNMSRWAQGDGVASWHVHDHMLVYLHTKNLRYPPDLPLIGIARSCHESSPTEAANMRVFVSADEENAWITFAQNSHVVSKMRDVTW